MRTICLILFCFYLFVSCTSQEEKVRNTINNHITYLQENKNTPLFYKALIKDKSIKAIHLDTIPYYLSTKFLNHSATTGMVNVYNNFQERIKYPKKNDDETKIQNFLSAAEMLNKQEKIISLYKEIGHNKQTNYIVLLKDGHSRKHIITVDKEKYEVIDHFLLDHNSILGILGIKAVCDNNFESKAIRNDRLFIDYMSPVEKFIFENEQIQFPSFFLNKEKEVESYDLPKEKKELLKSLV
ncbi:MAG: hypothetical protein IKX31_06970 [Muribaculaceae bacterium]|nr:hypothetical protein [Muribaculaceae bacterium]